MIVPMTEQLIRIDGARLDRAIGRTIKGIAVGRGIALSTVWDALGVGKSAWYEKAKGQSHFTAGEVARAAELLDVKIQDIYSGMGGLFDPESPISGGVNDHFPIPIRSGRTTQLTPLDGLVSPVTELNKAA